MIVTRVVADRPVTVGTADGYLYRWEDGSEPLDVLAAHQDVLLALPGFRAVEVEVVDPPVVLPAVTVETLIPPTPDEPRPVQVRVTPYWSAADIELLHAQAAAQ